MEDVSIIPANEDVPEPWERQYEEPKQWFLRFQRYYLYCGLSRSIRRAYENFVRENYPNDVDKYLALQSSYNAWKRFAREWKWQTRASAWDEMRNEELRKEVLDASRFLMQHALRAASALVEALDSPRLQVVAANSILDRIGIPIISRQEVTNTQITISADDLAAIKDDIKKWETAQLGKSG